MQTQSRRGLLSLPGEIKVLVWRHLAPERVHVLCGRVSRRVAFGNCARWCLESERGGMRARCFGSGDEKRLVDDVVQELGALEMGYLRVCKQMYHEYREVLFACSTFVFDDLCLVQLCFDQKGTEMMDSIKHVELFFHRHPSQCLAWAPQLKETGAEYQDASKLVGSFNRLRSLNVRFGSLVLNYIGEQRQPEFQYEETAKEHLRSWQECFLAHLSVLLRGVKKKEEKERALRILLPAWRAPLWYPAEVAICKFFQVDWDTKWCEDRLEQLDVIAKTESWNNLEDANHGESTITHGPRSGQSRWGAATFEG
ncbi:hypothetical protein EJ04DRAFT_22617 [Polyplosphaeria fusca]|uniref:DUF7730 domain-containing protein n=1 Tax=Polyplosphaeria fusca TaxID=682080 RepID=A0A9P4R3I8_9PLEO|nr:hypothetical protein EJ04DRAFT_22617 [Polyplosphaeria fusca]